MKVNRTEKITFRCTALEKAALAEQAARCGISISEYCRTLALGGRPKERYTEEERELFREIARLKGTLQRLNNYFGAEYKASEIGKGYTLAHIEKTQKKLKYNSISRNYGNTLKPKDGGLHL